MSGRVLVVAEQRGGALAPVCLEVVRCAREIAAVASLDLCAAVLGRDCAGLAAEFSSAAGVDTLAVQGAGLEPYTAEAHLTALEELIAAVEPALICMAHSSQGLDLAPRLAARWDAAYLAAAEAVSARDDGLVLSRAAFGGRVVLELAVCGARAVVTVQPGAFAPTHAPDRAGAVRVRETAAAPRQTHVLGLERVHGCAEAVVDAEIIVAAGRGVGGPQGLALVERLARLLPRAAVAGSRPVCDAGWLPYSRQVGMTGATVAPRLYLACGISGARQHTVGMRDAELVVSVNSDPEAAFHDLADVIVIENLEHFLPELIDELERNG